METHSAFDFTSQIDRRGKDAMAIDAIGTAPSFPGGPAPGIDPIPMWVADMNFKTAPVITQAMKERLEHPLFGYYLTPDAFYDSIISWHDQRNHVSGMKKEDIGYENGVLGGLASALSAFTSPGEKILLHSPCYIGFFSTLKGLDRLPELSPLKQDAGGVWRMDYADMDRRIKENHIRLAVLSSPHNPCGRVWEKEELLKAMEVFRENDCLVVSDEIWSDLTLFGHQHIPTQSVSEDARMRTIALYSPSKTFNLAGLVAAYHVIYSESIREAVNRVSVSTHYNSMNVLSMHALMAGYTREGAAWLAALTDVLEKNVSYACDFIGSHLKGVSTVKPQGTYMLFLHCEEACKALGISQKQLLSRGWKRGVIWQDGEPFGDEWGIRLNLALPYDRLLEAMDRLTAVFAS